VPHAAEAGCIQLFVSSEKAEQIAVGHGTERLGAVAVIVQTDCREDLWPMKTVLIRTSAKANERSQSDTVPTIQLAQCIKDLGFELGGLGVDGLQVDGL
jgi:hypothetical protein